MLLVTGCGRSGTKYTCQVLNELGITVGHEKVAKDGTVDWHLAYSPEGYDIILHQVRNPLQVIASCHTIMQSSWEFIAKHEHRISLQDSLAVRCMKYWLYWNQQAEKISDLTYQVEKQPIREIVNLCGKQVPYNATYKINILDRKCHSRQKMKTYHPVAIEDLRKADKSLCADIIDLAQHYGYKITKG